jgi:cytidylate kinase
VSVVTIRGEMGSGASVIGREVARLIEGDYVDRRVLEDVAGLLGRPPEQVGEKERMPPHLRQRILGVLEKVISRSGTVESTYSRAWKEPLDDAKYLDALDAVITDLALTGNIVIVGRGSQFILRHYPSALHVLVITPLKERIGRVMVELGVDEDDARRQIGEVDSSRRDFIKRFFRQDLEDPNNYDLVISTEHLSYEAATQIIVVAASQKVSGD